MKFAVSSVLKIAALCGLLALPHIASARAVNPDHEAKLSAATLTPKPLTATGYVLVDPASGQVLAEQNAHLRLYPASTTKIMTALVTLRSGIPLDTVVTIGPNPGKTGESSMYLQWGEHLTLRQLLQAALIKSANDACVALAEAVAGDVPHFVAKMNATAHELGARDTHFVNPHGLHDPQHFTTPYDLSLIARAALKYPVFNAIIRTKEVKMPGNKVVGPTRILMNHNRLLWRWDACDGVKTGYTRQAGRCLVATATERDPRTGQSWRLLSVVMHAQDSWSDAANLLQYHGFTQFDPVQLAGAKSEQVAFDAKGGAFPGVAMTQQAVSFALRPAEAGAIERRTELLTLSAPIKSGQPVGNLEFWTAGRKLTSVPLVARDAVPANAVARFMPVAGGWLPVQPARRWAVLALLVAGIAGLWSAILIRRRVRYDNRFRRSH